MSLLQEELVNFSTKGWLGILGSANRNSAPKNLAWYEEISSIENIVTPTQVWLEHSSIPEAIDDTAAIAAAAGSSIVQDRYSSGNAIHCTPSATNTLLYATSTYGDLSTRIKNWIMPQLIPRSDAGFEGFPSMGYMIRVFEGDITGTEVSWEAYTGAANTYREITTSIEQNGTIVGWFMNFGAGAIVTSASFESAANIDPTNIWIKGFTYNGKFAGEGGAGSSIPRWRLWFRG